MRLRKGAYVMGAEVIESDDQQLLVITERGFGKRTNLDEYPHKGRGGMGVRTLNITPKTGNAAALRLVKLDEELMIVSEEGFIIRTDVESISAIGRNTQGVTVMKVDEGDRVATIANFAPGETVRSTPRGTPVPPRQHG